MNTAALKFGRSVKGTRRAWSSPPRPTRSQVRSQHSQSKRAAGVANPRRRFTYAMVGIAAGYGAYRVRVSQEGGDSDKSLNTSTFTPFNVVRAEKVSPTCSIFTLEQPALPASAMRDMWKSGVWSIEIKQPQLQIARSYTPLPPLDPPAPESQLRLLVRKERRGEMSNYIHGTPENGTLQLRGPAVEYQLPQKTDQVVFLAGGTGIAPALQVAHALQDDARMSILWANRRREECEGGRSDTLPAAGSGWLARLGERLGMSPQSYAPATATTITSNAVVDQLDRCKARHKASLTVDYFVDDENTLIRPEHVKSVLSQRHPDSQPAGSGERLIFVSGPEGFLNYWAGPKEWRDGRETQGPLGGALSRMRLDGWTVVKL